MATGIPYTVRIPGVASTSLVSATTNPALQIALSAGFAAKIWGWQISQEASTTSTAFVAELLVSDTTAPGTLGNTAGAETVCNNGAWRGVTVPFTVTTSGFTGTLTGNQYRVRRVGTNFLGGDPYGPVPEVIYETKAAEFIWVRLPSIAAGTYTVEVYLEITA